MIGVSRTMFEDGLYPDDISSTNNRARGRLMLLPK